MVTWFDENDIKIDSLIKNKLYTDNIRGYVLPHAGTTNTGHILSHTLRFYPKNFFKKVLILYYPAKAEENVVISDQEKYYHEYYVMWKTLEHVIQKKWRYGKKQFLSINVRDLNNKDNNQSYLHALKNLKKTLLIISADFSHFLDLHDAIKKENCAAHAIMHRHFPKSLECLNIVDDVRTFKFMYEHIPNNWLLQWLGRTRSTGEKGVGYLSFLIKTPQPHKKFKKPDGMFVTAYDDNMQQRECLGEWFKKQKYRKEIEQELVDKVIRLAKSTSRLTGGANTDIPVTHYTSTYLYRDLRYRKKIRRHLTQKYKNKKHKFEKQFFTPKFIRGYHGIKQDAFYLPDVMLENTFNDGNWIQPDDRSWPKSYKYNMTETLQKIQRKAGIFTRKNKNKNKKPEYELYYADLYHGKVDSPNQIRAEQPPISLPFT